MFLRALVVAAVALMIAFVVDPPCNTVMDTYGNSVEKT